MTATNELVWTSGTREQLIMIRRTLMVGDIGQRSLECELAKISPGGLECED